MRAAAWFAVAFAIAAPGAELRYARLGEMEGTVETRSSTAAQWQKALRNLPLSSGCQVRTAAASRAEIELDDGGALRLGPETLVELSDYLRLSTGQRITLVALDSGVAYFTGEPAQKDALSFVIPGGQVALRQGTRLRLEATTEAGQVSAIEGEPRVLTSAAEFDLSEGHTARLNAAEPERFEFYHEIHKMALDEWSERRDRVLAAPTSARNVPGLYFGVADLDTTGTWIETAQSGPAWKPTVPEGWAPFQKGRWLWHDTLGYTWVSAEPWGWLPYHYGRWIRLEPLGWVWAPGGSLTFSPGAVYWMRGSNLAGWGPLAPGEVWEGAGTPHLYTIAHTTFARFQAGAREIDPKGFTARPKEPLAVTQFVAAPVSPPLVPAKPAPATTRAAEVRFFRPDLRSESVAVAPAQAEPEPRMEVQAPSPPTPVQPEAVVQPGPAPVPPGYEDTYYAVPVYTGIVVVNPTERPDKHRGKPPDPPKPAPAPATPTPAAPTIPATPSAPGPRGIGRPGQEEQRRRTAEPSPQEPPKPAAATPKPSEQAPGAEQKAPEGDQSGQRRRSQQ